MFRRPVEVALHHFDVLYSTFQKRSWVTSSNEATYRDEYLKLLDTLRTNYRPDFDITSVSPDLIQFLMRLEFFSTDDHLLYLFKLCCLCMTTVIPQYPAVAMGKSDTISLRGRLASLILPCRSFLSEVPNFLSFCCGESNLEKFSKFSASFGQSAFCPSYDPWVYVDSFGRSFIYKSLLSAYSSVLSDYSVIAKGPEKLLLLGTNWLSDLPVMVRGDGWRTVLLGRDPLLLLGCPLLVRLNINCTYVCL